MDWSLYRCGRTGHITYTPDEAHIREYLRARTASGEAWRCLRCGSYVSGQPHAAGPASQAPLIRRGKEIRSEIILRFFAIERLIRFLLFGVIAYAIWRFAHSRLTIEQAFNREIPLVRTMFRQLGYNINHSSLIGLFQHALRVSPSKLNLIAAGVGAFAVVELIEGVGLWLAKRWGEYFAAAITSLGLPYEIYDITIKFTWTRLALFGLNLALVLYLVLTRRLFGARGGKHAYEARLRSESVLDEAIKAAAVSPLAGSAEASPGPGQPPAPGPGSPPGAGSWPPPAPGSWPPPATSSGPPPPVAPDRTAAYPGSGQATAYPGSGQPAAYPGSGQAPAPGSGPPVVLPGSGPAPAAVTTPFRSPTGATVVTGAEAGSDPAAPGQPDPAPPA
jgi:uncharacterized membrane protein (DUF2068 family)